MSQNEPPDEVALEIEHHRSKCPFVDKGVPGCLLKFRPDLTERDHDGVYFHAACGKQWLQGSYDPDDSDPSLETEECFAHPVMDETGYVLADWG